MLQIWKGSHVNKTFLPKISYNTRIYYTTKYYRVTNYCFIQSYDQLYVSKRKLSSGTRDNYKNLSLKNKNMRSHKIILQISNLNRNS